MTAIYRAKAYEELIVKMLLDMWISDEFMFDIPIRNALLLKKDMKKSKFVYIYGVEIIKNKLFLKYTTPNDIELGRFGSCKIEDIYNGIDIAAEVVRELEEYQLTIRKGA